MKKTANATHKPLVTRSKKVAPDSGITGIVPLDRVLGCSFFHANIQATGGGAFTSAEIPFAPPAGVPVWHATPSITDVGYLHHQGLGVLREIHVWADIFSAPDGSPVLKISGSMDFDRPAPDNQYFEQIDISGQLMFYSAPATAKSALKRFNAQRIKILTRRHSR